MNDVKKGVTNTLKAADKLVDGGTGITLIDKSNNAPLNNDRNSRNGKSTGEVDVSPFIENIVHEKAANTPEGAIDAIGDITVMGMEAVDDIVQGIDSFPALPTHPKKELVKKDSTVDLLQIKGGKVVTETVYQYDTIIR